MSLLGDKGGSIIGRREYQFIRYQSFHNRQFSCSITGGWEEVVFHQVFVAVQTQHGYDVEY